MDKGVSAVPKRRSAALDLIRVAAISAVILIHVSASFLSNNEIGSSAFFWGNLVNGFSRPGVPLFLMTSGALLLDEERAFSLKALFTKRIPSLLFLLVFWSLAYAGVYRVLVPLLHGQPIDVPGLVDAAVLGHYHLWYLYIQIGLYMALPFLRAFVTKKHANLVLLFFGGALAAEYTKPLLDMLSPYWSGAQVLAALFGKLGLSFFGGFTAYFLMGWYIAHVGIPRRRDRHIAYTLSLLAATVNIAYVGMTKDYGTAYGDLNLLVFLYASGAFLFLYRVGGRVGGRVCRLLEAVSRASFGMYVIHVALLSTVIGRIIPISLPVPVCIAVRFAVTFGLSYAVTWGIAKIPLISKTVRM